SARMHASLMTSGVSENGSPPSNWKTCSPRSRNARILLRTLTISENPTALILSARTSFCSSVVTLCPPQCCRKADYTDSPPRGIADVAGPSFGAPSSVQWPPHPLTSGGLPKMKRVLLADDSVAARKSIQTVLEVAGIDVVAVGNGDLALSRLAE